MNEQDIRVLMQPKWRAVQEAFIDMCGNDFEAMRRREDERKAMEAPLIAEYHARVAALAEVTQ